MQIRRISLSLIAASALALAACGGDANDPATTDPGVATTETFVVETPIETQPGEDAGDTRQNYDEVNGWVLAAIAKAEAEAGGAAVAVDDEDFDQAWEVDVFADGKVTEVKLNAQGTEVLGTGDSDSDLDDGEDQVQPGQLAAAIEAALAHTPGVVDGAELEEDNGTSYWGVDLDGTENGDDVELRVTLDGSEVTPDN